MRPRSRISLTFWLLIAALLPLVVLPPFGYVVWDNDRPIVFAALTGILLTVLWRAWMMRRLRREAMAWAHERYGERLKEVLTHGRAVPIDGSWIAFWLLLGAFAALFVWAAVRTPSVGLIAGALLFTSFFGLVTLLFLPAVSRPALILRRDGVQPAGYGLLPWSAVQGIELFKARQRFGTSIQMLRLFVPDLPDRLDDAHPAVRVLRSMLRFRRFREVVTVPLGGTLEPPESIERLCRDLWKAATGRENRWYLNMSAAEARLAVEMSGWKNRLSRAPTLENAQQDLRAMREMNEHVRAATEAMKSRMAWTQLGIGGATAFMLLAVANVVADMLTSFVASDAWVVGSLLAALILVLPGYAIVLHRFKKASGGPLTGRRKAGVLTAMGVSAFLFVPAAWLPIQSVVGDPVSRSIGIEEEISVAATKTDSYRRRGCSKRLRGGGLGQAMCLSPAEYDRLPSQVTVALRIRRTAFGYHVDTQTIVSDEAPRPTARSTTS